MTCRKHIQRKRPNSCPDCAAELNKVTVVTEVPIQLPGRKAPVVVKQEKIVEKTSRDMLAEISSMEKEVDEMVIKKERVKKDKLIDVPQEPIDAVFVNFEKTREEYEERINKYFEDKVKEFKSLINSMSNPRYETLYVPIEQFSVKLMDTLNKEGWRLINFWDSNIAKASSVKRDVAVMERVVKEGNKPKPEYKL